MSIPLRMQKKQKIDDNLMPFPQTESDSNVQKSGKTALQRKKSIYVEGNENFKKTADYIREVEQIYSNVSSDRVNGYEHLEIPSGKLLVDGEVPAKWLQKYKDFKTWKDLIFQCGAHCDRYFTDLFSVVSHNFEKEKDSDHEIICPLCESPKAFLGRNRSLPTFINHVAKNHKLKHLKYCCIICSKTFFNMPHLADHMKKCHENTRLVFIPCFDCGYFSTCKARLMIHMKTHEKP